MVLFELKGGLLLKPHAYLAYLTKIYKPLRLLVNKPINMHTNYYKL